MIIDCSLTLSILFLNPASNNSFTIPIKREISSMVSNNSFYTSHVVMVFSKVYELMSINFILSKVAYLFTYCVLVFVTFR